MRHLFRPPTPQLDDRGPLRVMFVHTEVVIGGAETLLAEIIRNMDRERFHVELCCLKQLAELGAILAKEVPTHVGLLNHKYDVMVFRRLVRLLRERSIDAVVTVGTGGDRMFWGRLAAWRAGVPVILSALHSTGYPQVVEPLNRMLAPITDGFIGCAAMHAHYLSEHEGCPQEKTFAIYNGVDTQRFCPRDRTAARRALGIESDGPLIGIVAALRPEKQHVMLVEAMRSVVNQFPTAQLVIVGDGVTRTEIEQTTRRLALDNHVMMLGMRSDVERILPALDIKALSSKMEANPASTLEAAACEVAVVAPSVGSIPETVIPDQTGLLYPANDQAALSEALLTLCSDMELTRQMGERGRQLVCERFSLDVMVRGYERLIESIYRAAADDVTFESSAWNPIEEPETGEVAAEPSEPSAVANL